MAIFFALRIQKSAARKLPNLRPGDLNSGLTSKKLTHYLLDFGDC